MLVAQHVAEGLVDLISPVGSVIDLPTLAVSKTCLNFSSLSPPLFELVQAEADFLALPQEQDHKAAVMIRIRVTRNTDRALRRIGRSISSRSSLATMNQDESWIGRITDQTGDAAIV